MFEHRMSFATHVKLKGTNERTPFCPIKISRGGKKGESPSDLVSLTEKENKKRKFIFLVGVKMKLTLIRKEMTVYNL